MYEGMGLALVKTTNYEILHHVTINEVNIEMDLFLKCHLCIILIFLQDNALFKKNYTPTFFFIYTAFPPHTHFGGVMFLGVPVSET
jgi:hypothetical protein